MADTIEVLIVDDSPFMRRAVERMLAPLEHVHIVGTAANGREAVEQARRLRPDVIILDIVMPEMDGLDAIRGIMEQAPTPILVLSSHARPGAETTLAALDLGAVDFISKSAVATPMDIHDLAPALREKLLIVAGSRVPRAVAEQAPPEREVLAPDQAPATVFEVLAIGASTGGPNALASLLAELPANFPVGIVVAQHMPPGFTDALASRLDRRCRLTVQEARDGDPVRPGIALIGVGGRHLLVGRGVDGLVVRVSEGDGRFLHRPSVDLLLESVARSAGDRSIGVVLTGMGEDGAKGLAAIRAAGGRTITESEESAVIYGMPGAARPAAERVLALDRIAPAIRRIVEAAEV